MKEFICKEEMGGGMFIHAIYEPEKELIRCKECKHRDPEDKMCDSGHGIRWQLPREDDWFCADGERG